MLKKTLTTVFTFVISLGLLSAQTTKGKVIIGLSSSISMVTYGSDLMSLGYSSVKNKSNATGYQEPKPDKMVSFNLSPKTGYFIIDNLAIGIDLTTSLSTAKNGEDDSKSSNTLFSAGPFIRYYLPTSKVLPFFEISSSFGSSKNKFEDANIDPMEFKSSVMALGGGFGLAVPLGDKVTFDVLAGYNSLIIKYKEDNPDNDRTVVGTIGLKLGFSILLGSD